MVGEECHQKIKRSRLQLAATIALVIAGLGLQLVGSLTK
jgi:hypothetical protein